MNSVPTKPLPLPSQCERALSAVNRDFIKRVQPSKHFWCHHTPISKSDLLLCNDTVNHAWSFEFDT